MNMQRTHSLMLAGLLIAGLTAFQGRSARADDKPVNVNTATATELAAIKGVGDVKAKAIVEYRGKNGPFKSVEDLRDVRGIGDGVLAKLRPQVTVGTTAAVAPAGAPAPAQVPA